MSERDYMAEFNEASSRSRDILIEAGGHINYLRSLLRDLLPFLPKNHPWLPGINEQIEALPVDERDATIAALKMHLASMCGWADTLAAMAGWKESNAGSFYASYNAARKLAPEDKRPEPPSGETSGP